MKEFEVEGYKVLVERGEEGKFTITVPSLPGIIGQVDDEKDAHNEIRRLIGRYFVELTKKKPNLKPDVAPQSEKKPTESVKK